MIYELTYDGTGTCNLSPSWQIQTIPRGSATGVCEPYWANWGIIEYDLNPQMM